MEREKYKKINYSYDKQNKKYSVLVLLINIDGEISILFEVRSKNLSEKAQPGDISFPGGLCENDDIEAEALRETYEEVGIGSGEIEILGRMNPVMTGDERHIIPVVGYAKDIDISKLNICKDEVEEVFAVPLDFFLNTEPVVHVVNYQAEFDDMFPFDKIHNGKDYRWKPRREKIYFYYYNDYNIWGITAKIINQFIGVIKRHEEEI
jgi:8-oxo-dGTP pyrophosphatase MutT (NUDIX family)